MVPRGLPPTSPVASSPPKLEPALQPYDASDAPRKEHKPDPLRDERRIS